MVVIVRQNLIKNQRQFAVVKRRLLELLGDDAVIEHVGSTAVPGLVGKNIIDVLIGVRASSDVVMVSQRLVQAGWFVGQKCDVDYCFLASRQEETVAGDVHLHLALVGGQRYRQFVEIRDFLRHNPGWRRRYNQVKCQLVRELRADRATYKQLKSQFVEQILAEIAQKQHKSAKKLLTK